MFAPKVCVGGLEWAEKPVEAGFNLAQIVGRQWTLGIDHLIQGGHQTGKRAQPLKVFVVEDQIEQFKGTGFGSCFGLIRILDLIEKGQMKCPELLGQIDEVLAEGVHTYRLAGNG